MTYQLPSTFIVNEDAELDDPETLLNRNLRIGLIVVGVLLFGLFGLAAIIQTSGAVIGMGEVTVESRVKHLAHPTGGVIAQIFVRDGDKVRKGQALMRLDTTVSSASASNLGESLEQLLAARARLEAERDGLSTISFPPELTRNPTPSIRAAMEQAQRLFSTRAALRASDQSAYQERIHQTEQEIRGLEAQRSATDRQTALVKPELDGVRSLYERKLVTISRMNQLERTAVDLQGTSASFTSRIAEARARIAELRQASIQSLQTGRSAAGTDLAEVQARLSDQKIRTVAADDALDRSMLRAPNNGIVDKMNYTTIGGVVPPSQIVMDIVPDADRLTVDARIPVTDIDQLHLGQETILRFSAFNMQTTPQLKGAIAYIAPERTTDERTGASYYKARIEVGDAELRRLDGLKLKPGMPVEAFIQTGSRSLLSYITKPLRDQFNRAFRES